jgi:hypothetical protein
MTQKTKENTLRFLFLVRGRTAYAPVARVDDAAASALHEMPGHRLTFLAG